MPFALTISGLSKTYPNGVRALDGVSLTIPTGMFGLLGPNGAGKSTLMRTLATLQEADAGTVQMGDIDVLRDKAAVRRTLGYLPQDFGVYPKVSAEELLDHLARLKGLTQRRQRSETVATLLRQTNLYDVRRKALGGFSGGMRQRFGIAQALLGNPRLIIVDEPTAGLDPEERVRFHNLLAEIGENVIVILSTHIVSDVSDLCGRMAIINQGRVMLAGSPADLTRTLEGRVWQKAIDRTALDAARSSFPVISTRLLAGRTLVNVVADAPPGARIRRRRAYARRCLLRCHRRPAPGERAGAGSWHERVACDRLVRVPYARQADLDVGVFPRLLRAGHAVDRCGGRCCSECHRLVRQRQGVGQLAVRNRADRRVSRDGRADDRSPRSWAGRSSRISNTASNRSSSRRRSAAAITSADASWAPSPCWSSSCRAFRSAASPDCCVPGIDTDRVGPMRLAAYVAPYADDARAERRRARRTVLLHRGDDAPDVAGLHRERACC